MNKAQTATTTLAMAVISDACKAFATAVASVEDKFIINSFSLIVKKPLSRGAYLTRCEKVNSDDRETDFLT